MKKFNSNAEGEEELWADVKDYKSLYKISTFGRMQTAYAKNKNREL